MAAASFAQVLDDMLGRVSAAAPPPPSWAARPGIADSAAFVFARPLTPGVAWARAYSRPSAGAAFVAPAVPVEAVAPVDLPSMQATPCVAAAAPVVVASSATAPGIDAGTTPRQAEPAAAAPPRASAAVPPSAPTAGARRAPAPRLSPIVRARRVLTVKEQRALDRLLLLGARLDDQFTADDLRREYRALALRLHPDRHALAPAADRAMLAEAFARATASYRCLQAVHAPRA
ncbi:MAG: J domain-containing protein [Vicinamibacterales bacterium]